MSWGLAGLDSAETTSGETCARNKRKIFDVIDCEN
jgi:hypothetical protein